MNEFEKQTEEESTPIESSAKESKAASNVFDYEEIITVTKIS